MSYRACPEAHSRSCGVEKSVELVIEPKGKDLGGGLQVRRVLPTVKRRMVGPFVFFDHMGPSSFEPGQGIDVRPHPHIHLATVSYLFEGEIDHRDSLGYHQAIQPGAINWMTAGKGIVHSERERPEAHQTAHRLHGIQLWVGLPTAKEDMEPSFTHHPSDTIPELERDGAKVRVLLGSAYGQTSPVEIHSPMTYLDIRLPAGTTIDLPDDHPERAAYIAEGTVSCGAEVVDIPKMLIFEQGARAILQANSDARVMFIAGEPLDGPRYMYWNFLSSSKERIEQAKRDWKEGKFGTVPGDDKEFIPLPE